jgi:bifunctional oligoribonuclease and PAP phosphatase NrnA
MSYQSNITLSQAAQKLHHAHRIVLTTHAKPDGDAIGSVVALSRGLSLLGKEAPVFVMPPLPANLRALRGCDTVHVVQNHEDPRAIAAFALADLVVVLDTGAWSQLAPLRGLLEKSLDRTLILDHHLSGDVLASERYIDARAAACCEVVGALLDELTPPSQHARHAVATERITIDTSASGDTGVAHEMRSTSDTTDFFLSDPALREALFVGIASDTGWFRFSNTRPQTHELAAKLIRAGVDHAALYETLEQTDRPQKLALMQRAMANLSLHASGQVAVMVLRKQDFTETGARLEETERLTDIPQSVTSVRMVVVITETPDDAQATPPTTSPTTSPTTPTPAQSRDASLIRISFRSKPGPNAINVAQLASQFQGGGHARAAGAKVQGQLDDVVTRVLAAIAVAVPTN